MKEQESPNLASTRNLLIWVLLISLSGVTFLTAYYFAPTLQNRDQVIDPCPEDIARLLGYKHEKFDIQNNPVIAIEINGLSSSNEFISLEAFPVSESSHQVEIEFEISSFAVDANHLKIQQFAKKEDVKAKFHPPEPNQKDYSAQSLAKIEGLSYQNYLFVLKIKNTDKVQEQKVHDLQLTILTLNPAYSQRLNYFKWFLFTVALVSWILYRNNISKLPDGYSSREQDYISQMAFILLLFTQPFTSFFAFSATFWYKIFVVLLVAALGYNLISFWLSLLKRLHAIPNPASDSNGLIFVTAAVHFLVIAGGYGLLVKEQDENPLLDYGFDKTLGITICRYYSYAFIGLMGIWSLLKLPKIIGKIKELDWRDSSALLFSFYYILCYIFFIYTGSLQVTAARGTRVVILFGVTTLYTIILQVMYAPFSGEVDEADKRNKYNNPATNNQYDDLDMSDAAPKDDVELKGRDKLKGRPKNVEDDESEDI